MLFNSFTYLLFLPLVVALHWALPPLGRRILLLIASYVFYMNWMPTYGLLILGLTAANFFFGIAIDKYPHNKKGILTASLVFNLGGLCFFKYADFLLKSAWSALHITKTYTGFPAAIPDSSPVLNILLPLGISFFTFEFIHYLVDVYRGSKPMTNFFWFALFAAFFPSQIAGPIKRFQDFDDQLKANHKFDFKLFREGLGLIFIGLFKKMVLGDNLGRVVAVGFNNPLQMGTVDAWLAAVGFTIQIYVDFSGYTDIGRGSALLLGYKLPENFNWPFLAASLTEFWRRWHISLSTWLRDYLFIPMGGSRVSNFKLKRNLFITMALGGLWHGADWHYVIWGMFHGAGLVVTKDWSDLVNKTPWLSRLRPHFLWHWSGVVFTFTFLIFACVLFRATSIPHTLQVISRMFTLAPSSAVLHAFMVSTLPVSLTCYAIFLALERLAHHSVKQPVPIVHNLVSYWSHSWPARLAVCVALGLVIMGFTPEDVSPFIYFQF
ncbi:MAG: hypothetical protein K2W82_17895 [Candidatus Obscuribacterales bacterium]|nr:hypothetical protein [Candidatus Obscuribacterales bacterium]